MKPASQVCTYKQAQTFRSAFSPAAAENSNRALPDLLIKDAQALMYAFATVHVTVKTVPDTLEL